MNLGSKGIGVMIGWCLWLVIYLTVIETLERRNSKQIAEITMSDLSKKLFNTQKTAIKSSN
jgi:hypothetical protein